MAAVSLSAPSDTWCLRMDGIQWAWALFDAGCWGYASVTINTLVPLVFKQDAPKDEAKYVSAVWANTVAAGTLMSGLVCPFFGAILDMYGWRKAAVMTTSIAMCVCLSIFAQISGDHTLAHLYVMSVVVAVVGVMFYSSMQAIYNSLIVHVSEQSEDHLTWLSATQCAIGNGGAMILMMCLGIQDAKHSKTHLDIAYVQQCFLVAAGWFLVLSTPLFVYYQEEPAREQVKGRGTNLSASVRASLASFKRTLQNREMCKYMLATLIYSDTSATLFSVYLIYGSQVGISNAVLLECAVVNRWLGLVMGFGWYFVGAYVGAKMAFVSAIGLTLASAVCCALVHSDADFQAVNVLMAAAGSGGYIYSRVLMARLTTKAHTSQHFGFLAAVSRVSGIFGPLVYGWIVYMSGARAGLCALAALSVPSLWLVSLVDFDVGRQCNESQPIENDSGPDEDVYV